MGTSCSNRSWCSALLAFVVLAGCGFKAPFNPARTCDLDRGVVVFVEKDRDGICDFAQQLVDDARTRAIASGVMTRDQAERILTNTPIWLHEDYPQIICQGQEGGATGCFEGSGHWSGDIELNRTGSALLHEMFHNLDESMGASEKVSGAHTGWLTRNGTAGTDIQETVYDTNGSREIHYELNSWWDLGVRYSGDWEWKFNDRFDPFGYKLHSGL
jgi:hypothetical protein